MIETDKTIIIAEAGVNHNGDFEKAKQLIRVAARAGADYVKFQTFKADKIVSRQAKRASYQNKNINDGDNSQYNMLRKLEIPDKWYPDLLNICKEEKIKFLSTGFDIESIDFLNQLPIELFKIPSGEITNKPYLQHIAAKRKPVVLSTGMADMEEVNAAVAVLMDAGLPKSNITILHCNTEYPTPMKDVNLKAMLHIKNEIGVEVGYSDHTLGLEVPIAAVALGAKVIEKHFTLDRKLPGPDHKASIEPNELEAMIKAIRNVEIAISGNGIKEISKSEILNRKLGRKSIHLKHQLNKDHQITINDLIMLRPGDGISPMDLEKIIGKKVKRPLNSGDKLAYSDIY